MTDGLEDDPALLAAFRRGETDALATVYRRYVQDVAGAIRHGVRVRVDGQIVRVGRHIEEVDVEVAVQDTFVRAFSPRARLAYDGTRSFSAWITTIARNLLIDRARAAKADHAVVSLDVVGDDVVAGEGVDPDWAIEVKEIQAAIAAADAAWNERERRVFRLRYIEGLSQKAAAEALGLAAITVRRLDARIRASLLGALRDAGHLSRHDVGIPQVERDRSKG